MHETDAKESKAWYKFGHVWLIISGPAIVVVASFITLYLAVVSPNEIVTDEGYQQSAVADNRSGHATVPGGQAPALQARNHAATGAVPVSK